MNQTLIPAVLKQLPADFFDLEQDKLSEAESARQGYRIVWPCNKIKL